MISIILHNIRSAHNVGSIFRTADGAGVERVYLTGITPTPIDRFGREDPKIAKVALGAEKTLSWEKRNINEILTALKKDGVQVVALEQDPRSIPYTQYVPHEKCALLLGTEVGGIEKGLLERADIILEIPMHGKKDSLNVSVATGIALFEIKKPQIKSESETNN
ncbi:TrmH family RNA methyltransferase [Candidatus Kaiserbacteria bacterium CG10_big_fil_rev_8_21_14_0_10_45_20]|uniref:TrmH family RNA methyltransferase n=1 Tax=Candidatus Kaiserbacteria bacterium CG10_big_fil_rev_8_21_14_0_10_45_20 TaxID=1974607 RepID=A0A2H0UGX3_9BACT|nr:MAG: TrmH family RNA methyltransferase [Candidatus Kaiserbacteria bacterium CG10_big_fil_rev_8_21_14_0_10_45_20]